MENFLTIRNFGAITDVTLKLKPVMIITGGQGTGKSTIAKLISIFSDMMFYINILKDNTDQLLTPFAFHGIQSYFQDNSFFEYQKGDIHILYEEQNFRFIIPDGFSQETWLNLLFKRWGEAQMELLSNLGIVLPKTEGEIQTVLLKHLKLLEANSRQTLYLPAERNLAGTFSNVLASMMLASIPLPKLFTTYLSLFEKSKNEFSSYEVPFLHLEFKKDGSEEMVVFNHDKQIKMQYCSSGVQSVLPLLMIIDYSIKKGLFNSFIIEEPEQNLFPENQFELIRSIIDKLHSTVPIQELVITTHSPYVLSTINLSLIAGKIAKNDKFRDELKRIVPSEYYIDPDIVAAYSLGDHESYSKNIINQLTGTIDQNYLDSTSSIISGVFQNLYHLYIRSLKEQYE